ncbi:hypothetical protein AALO_G00087290 [Alosa alosa]|uniref:Uncharacterized protein n=1 Tax=Alosa alosa TaxID=278164 RepID=A0AAV6H2U6_9TELE|nr:hypothetical protein AALO_G00087290 [Alosa alosa]
MSFPRGPRSNGCDHGEPFLCYALRWRCVSKMAKGFDHPTHYRLGTGLLQVTSHSLDAHSLRCSCGVGIEWPRGENICESGNKMADTTEAES